MEFLLNHHNVKIVSPIAVYYSSDDSENDVNIEVAVPVMGNLPESERIKIRKLKAVKKMACVIHKGNNDKLADAYTAIQKWMEMNGYEIAGPSREVHLEGYWSTSNEDKHVTEIQIPVVKS
ncbi:GyrI-like domain-containing protein [Aneurinibacillus thermoaerophilus]|uniref:GyrI-like domain-containing protein n=1 Tax=Aneurinibacillus thermoaerophilus TaxID=143495 RepID=UPI002E22928A|nr:GyrI-like domain-containing protein [Aneurinibacillus thermoaerophilus]MED0763278.1 GyrI-like domain-containing protein [Aneurinibacillus thermoaerophilus]